MKNLLRNNFLTALLILTFLFLAIYQLRKEHSNAEAKKAEMEKPIEKTVPEESETHLAGIN